MVDEKYLLQCMTKAMLTDVRYLTTIATVFDTSYFADAHIADIFAQSKAHLKQFQDVPDKEIILNSCAKDIKEEQERHFKECDAIDFDIAKNYDWLFENTEIYLKDKAVKQAIVKAVDIIDQGENVNQIRPLVESALIKTLKVDLGLNYFDQLGERLKRIFSASDNRIRSYMPVFDEFISGGFPPYTLSVFVARIHGFKSNVMANILSRQAINGHNVALASLEMSEDMFAQRFDAIYSNLDINRIYINKRLQKELIAKLSEIKKRPERGGLYIKQYPTGAASVADFRMWLREMEMRGIKMGAFYCDYINLMQPEYETKGQLYSDVKRISEELRALGFEFDLPVISVSQLNRPGSFVNLDEVDFNYISESMGVPATADFMAILGNSEEGRIYEGEVEYKIVKNRLGGRVGDIDKFYFDDKSLKMYDSSELDLWIAEAEQSGGDRSMYEGADDVPH